MRLHNDKKLFSDTIRAAAQYLKINEVFMEKDYWITLVLNRLSKSKYARDSVFKGGTSLSKGFGLINRFSEDVDIAIIHENDKSGNEIKNIIRTVEKKMAGELTEIQMDGVTSKGSRFRKSVHEYKSIDQKNKQNHTIYAGVLTKIY
jgi:predicted nucleotidyltransferase component of viral defense system